jgi:hypothetical protein
MTNEVETFIVKVTDAHGRELFTGSFEAATYHRALRIAWSRTTDDRPVGSASGSRIREDGSAIALAVLGGVAEVTVSQVAGEG